MKKQFYVCAFAALLLYFIGCAPLPTFVLDPADGNSTWLHGKQIVSKSDGSFAVAVNEEEAEFEREMTSKAEAAEYRQTIRDLNDYRSYWKHVTLRKTSLGPNQSVSGKVYFAAKPFPPMKRMKMIKIYFPVGDKQYDFLFNRTKYKW